ALLNSYRWDRAAVRDLLARRTVA
ncbi:MAG: hypothetical protein QG622_501, partial [Actinomycetota bacterium]|nr:hypothetical protein [Actinomycetota bacterium]